MPPPKKTLNRCHHQANRGKRLMLTTINSPSYDSGNHDPNPFPSPRWFYIKNQEIHDTHKQIALHFLTTAVECQKADGAAALNSNLPLCLNEIRSKSYECCHSRVSIRINRSSRQARRRRSQSYEFSRGIGQRSGFAAGSNCGDQSCCRCLDGRRKCRMVRNGVRAIRRHDSQSRQAEARTCRLATPRVLSDGPSRYQHNYRRLAKTQRARFAIASVLEPEQSTRCHLGGHYGSLYGCCFTPTNPGRCQSSGFDGLSSGYSIVCKTRRPALFRMACQGDHPLFSRSNYCRSLPRKWNTSGFRQLQTLPHAGVKARHIALRGLR